MQSRNKSGWMEGSKQWQGVDNGTGVENRREDESYHCSDHHWNSTAAIWHQICGMWLKLGLIATITISLNFKGALCKPIGSLEGKQNLDLFVNPLFVIHLLAQIRTYFSPKYCPAMFTVTQNRQTTHWPFVFLVVGRRRWDDPLDLYTMGC